MKNNRGLWFLFGFLQQVASWGVVVVYALIKHGAFVASNGLVLAFAVALIFAIWMIMRALKETAEHGYGLNKKIARGVRLFIPLIVLLAAVLIINVNLVGIVDIIVIGVVGNLIALPFGVLSYYCSKQYIVDTGMVDLVRKANE